MSDPIKPQDDSPASGPAQANPAWALGQLARAEAHLDQVGQGKQPNPSALARALDRIHAWRSAIAGMVSGAIEVGKRAPVRDLPAWCTLEVLHGGFASGKALAGGPAQAHERWWLQQLADGQPLGATAADCAQIARLGEQAEDAAPSPTPQPVSRTALNDWFLGEAGIAQLLRWLDDGCWRISVPEEGALLSVAWLLQNGHEAEATDILDAIRPHWDKLRFYPIPAATPMPALGGVSVLSAQALLEYLNGLQTPVQLQAQHEAIHVWRPLFDALVTLWLQAVPQALNTQEGEATAHTPRLRPGTREAEGGLPVSMPDAAWCERARAWLARCKEVCASHAHGGAHRKPGSPFMQMVRHLEAVLAGHALSEGDARQLRFLLACQVSAHGVPGSAQHRAWRERQLAQTHIAWRSHWAAALARRVRAQGPFGPGDGVAEPDALQHPVTPQEAAEHAHLPAGSPLFPGMQTQLLRTRHASVPALVDGGMVPSSEVLAKLLPATTAEQWGQTMPDACGARLLGALWSAFRQRRSLLLLNMAGQVRFHQLPWVARLLAHRRGAAAGDGPGDDSGDGSANTLAALQRDSALAQLDAMARLVLSQFPQTPFPNPLLWEFAALAEQGGWVQAWAEEIAADIFMGSFGHKHGQAVATALPWLEGRGRLYAQHYRIDTAALAHAVAAATRAWAVWADYVAAPEGAPGKRRLEQIAKKAVDAFYKKPDALTAHLYRRLGLTAYGDEPRSMRSIEINGAVIEQFQVVGTANFAPLALRFGWGEAGDDARATKRRLHRHAQPSGHAARTGGAPARALSGGSACLRSGPGAR